MLEFGNLTEKRNFVTAQ
ncbi:hypothetical protein BDFB_015058 [Asbolus verrucosus]|uniref:Uncharacterized protein n=1 Tax=Asbolus verrucosus TaxID=1661398 RepID=A0A482VGR6_ASBVE|nr:hypothetical protein BDFB_015058 [Asbolus verrucosus]